MATKTQSSREKKRHKVFMARSGQLYGAMKQRLSKHIHGKDSKGREDLPFTLEQLRHEIRNAIAWGECIYLGSMEPLTEKNFSIDHEVPVSRGGDFCLSNLVVCSQRGNYAKGNMASVEFRKLLLCLDGMAPEAKVDVIGRLRAATASRHRIYAKR